METLFWGAFLVTAYVYAGYPALLAVWARLAAKPIDRLSGASGVTTTPGVTIVIAARNEAPALPARLDNLLSLDYPPDRLQIVVASDGSTDRTAAILHLYADRVDAVLLPSGGKALALNAGVERAVHDLLVFTDVRQTFAPDALRHLVAPFADPAVGGVTGELLLDCETGSSASTIGDGVGAYWRYEKWLRRQESAIASTLGATGAIYALRRTLWQPLPANTILDDVLAPMRAVLGGNRVVFEDAARAFDRAASAPAELRRKTRTLAGNYQILGLEPRLLVPIVNPVWLQYMSHKVGRLFVPWALMILFVSSAVLALGNPFYAAALAAQVVFYALAAVGAVLNDRRLPRLSFAFVMMNWAAVAGLMALAFRRRVWR